MGVALGDAMGMPVEFWPRYKIKEVYGRIEGLLPGGEDNEISMGLTAGTVTDDTHQTVLIARSLIENNGVVDPKKIAESFLRWFEGSGKKVEGFLGPSSKRALSDLSNGISIEETGIHGSTNGAAMRIIPVGIVSLPWDMEKLVYNVSLACMPTHNTDIAVAGAAGIAAAVSLALEGERIDGMVEGAMEAMKLGYRYGRKIVSPSVVKRTELALKILENCKSEDMCLEDLYDIIGTGLSPAESIPVALGLVKMADGDPMRGATLAANIGGDCDTIGAMTTGICAAMNGLDSVPNAYIRRIREVNEFDFWEIASKLAVYRVGKGDEGSIERTGEKHR